MRNDMKPCQAVARGTIQWCSDYEKRNILGRIDCKYCDRHAEIRVDKYTMAAGIVEHSKGMLLRALCKDCKEVEDGDS